MPMMSKGWLGSGVMRGTFLAAGTLALAACANSTPAPTETVALADSNIRNAETAGAVQHSPVELNMAREKLEGARREMQKGDNEAARRLAEEAEVDARLAEL